MFSNSYRKMKPPIRIIFSAVTIILNLLEAIDPEWTGALPYTLLSNREARLFIASRGLLTLWQYVS